jgi:hypothetical protein
MATTAARPCCGLASAGLAGTDTAIFSYRVGAFLASRSDEKLLGLVFCDGCSQLERLRWLEVPLYRGIGWLARG